MTPKESKVFLRVLVLIGLLWLLGAGFAFGFHGSEIQTFFSAFVAVALDLGFLILLFWNLFFSPYRGLARKLQVFFSFTFKLVCLGFLAITLKRLRNDPHLPVAFAVLFMGLGPLLSAVAARKWITSKQG
jgi:hypothetical protein